MHTGLDGLDDDLRKQGKFYGDRMPLYAGVLAAVRRSAALQALVEPAWRDRAFHAFYDRPLLLLAALHADMLRRGGAYATDDHALAAALARAEVQADLRERHVQTNETTRAVTWLWPAFLAGADGGARPIALLDVGASAGLNLVADALPDIWNVPVAHGVRATARVGIDARPLDVRDPAAVTWLRACVWPGEDDRRARLDAAIDAMHRGDASVRTGDVREAAGIARELAASGALVIAYQTLVREYLPPDVQTEYDAGMRAAVAAGGVVWMELETGPRDPAAQPAAVLAHVAGEALVLARCGYHPRALDIDARAVEAFTRLVRA